AIRNNAKDTRLITKNNSKIAKRERGRTDCIIKYP
ncbi:MAG: hypothetical protein RLZZ384_1156, partial [Pseudomonadota bacterium]